MLMFCIRSQGMLMRWHHQGTPPSTNRSLPKQCWLTVSLWEGGIAMGYVSHLFCHNINICWFLMTESARRAEEDLGLTVWLYMKWLCCSLIFWMVFRKRMNPIIGALTVVEMLCLNVSNTMWKNICVAGTSWHLDSIYSSPTPSW